MPIAPFGTYLNNITKNGYTPSPLAPTPGARTATGSPSLGTPGYTTSPSPASSGGLASYLPNLPSYQNAEDKAGYATQNATNVLNVLNQLQGVLGNFQGNAGNLFNKAQGLSANASFNPIKLLNNFKTDSDFQNQLKNGIDYFGRMGISEGLQNIALQRQAANNQLQSTLGQQPGNQALINVLKNQNFMRSQLAGQPLISDAQKGTADRISQAMNLANQTIQAKNQTSLQQGAYNQQAALTPLSTMLASLQPMNNLLDILTNLQGQGRGITSTENQISSKNYK